MLEVMLLLFFFNHIPGSRWTPVLALAWLLSSEPPAWQHSDGISAQCTNQIGGFQLCAACQ